MLLGKQHEKLNVLLPTLQYTEKRKLIILFSTSHFGMSSVISPRKVLIEPLRKILHFLSKKSSAGNFWIFYTKVSIKNSVLNFGSMLYRCVICRLTDTTPYFTVTYSKSYSYIVISPNLIFDVNFCIKALKASGAGFRIRVFSHNRMRTKINKIVMSRL